MLKLLIRRKVDVLRCEIREALNEAMTTGAPLELMFELAEARDVLEVLDDRGDARVGEVVRGVERRLRDWHRHAAGYHQHKAA